MPFPFLPPTGARPRGRTELQSKQRRRPSGGGAGWQLAEWIGELRARFDGAIVFAQPTNSPPEYDRVIRGLGLPVVWRKPSNRPKPSGFPPANDRGAHSNDVCAIEHANMLLSSLCT